MGYAMVDACTVDGGGGRGRGRSRPAVGRCAAARRPLVLAGNFFKFSQFKYSPAHLGAGNFSHKLKSPTRLGGKDPSQLSLSLAPSLSRYLRRTYLRNRVAS